MPDKTKITFSDKELSLVKDVTWILTKHAIMQKVYDLFAAVVPAIKAGIIESAALPEEVKLSVPKIFKGENYLQLPYVILDYPRCFEKENIFAVRTMFWWGNFISITLHVAGSHKGILMDKVGNASEALMEDFFIGVNEDQWQHHFGADNFIPYLSLSKPERVALIEKNDFIKLAIKFRLDDWNDMQALLDQGYQKVAALLT